MKIALLGYGKMGKVIEGIALQRGHSIIALKVTSKHNNYSLSDVDVAIDFSTPNSAIDNITKCFSNQVPVISGTTGWLDSYDKIVIYAMKKMAHFYMLPILVWVLIYFLN